MQQTVSSVVRGSFLAMVAMLGLSNAACSGNAPTPPAPPAEATAAAPEATSTATMEEVVARHVTAVKAGDVDAVMADYADDAILVSPPGMVSPSGQFSGKDKVREFFVWLASPAVLPGAKTMVSTNEIVAPNTLLFRWRQFPDTPNEVAGYDVLVFREGKVVFQTVVPNP